MTNRARLGWAILALALGAWCSRTARAEDDAELGTPHLVSFVAADPEGRWAVIRQARRDTDGDGLIEVRFGPHGGYVGDRMQHYLVRGSGPGEAIDAFAGSDPSGRYLAVVQDGALLLLDVQADTRVDLSARGADARDDEVPGRSHRAVSFDALGRRVATLRRAYGLSQVVVQDLAGGDEIVVHPGPGLLHRATLTPDGRWLSVEVLTRDTDGDGRITAPHGVRLNARPHRGIFSRRQVVGDRPELRLAPVRKGSEARAMSDVVCPLGDDLLVRDRDWTLKLRGADGRETTWVAGRHAALVLGANPLLGAAVVVCSSGPEKGRVLWIRGEERKALGPDAARIEPEHPLVHVTRCGRIPLLGQSAVVDYETGSLDVSEGYVMALHDDVALLSRGGKAVLRRVSSGAEVAVPVFCETGTFLRQAGAMCAVDGTVFDLSRMLVLGRYEGHPLVHPEMGHARAVRCDGRVLLALHAAHTPWLEGRYARGPLTWVAPTP